MLLTLVEVVTCENPRCREFARSIPRPREMRSYYCPVCGGISYPRVVDTGLAESPEKLGAFLRRILDESREPVLV